MYQRVAHKTLEFPALHECVSFPSFGKDDGPYQDLTLG